MTKRVWNIGWFAPTLLIAVFLVAAGCGESKDGGTGGTAGAGGTAGGAGTGGTAGAGGVGGGTACAETDCDDGNPCTENLCNTADGTCSNPTFTDGSTCSADENPGRCVAGVCTGLCEFVDCDDGNECTEDLCDPAHGSCFNPPIGDGTTCDAGGYPGQCSTGLCLGLCIGVDCDDGNECTEDLCDRADGSCNSLNRPDGSNCDFSGLPGRCMSGTCVDAELCSEVDCSDGNECTEDVCDPASANCSNPNKVDGSFCETGGNPGLCVAGLCQGLCEGVSCEDGNQCTVDMCDPSNASCPNPDKIDGTPCDYGDDPGRCSAGLCVGLCTGVVCNDHNQCTSDACDSATGSCTHTDRAEGTPCDFDGLPGVCIAGVCEQSQVDSTPPEVVDFTMTPVTFDASSADVTLNWCVTARDDLSGLDRVIFINVGRVDTPGVGLPGQYQGSRPSFSGELEGTVCGTVVIPQFAPIGRYIVTLLLEDRTGNRLTAAHPDGYQPGTFPGANEQDLCTVGVCEVENLGPSG